MGYTINAQNGMRSVDSDADCILDETYYDDLPAMWLLNQAQVFQAVKIDAAYAEAVQLLVKFTTAVGVTQTYQADNTGPLSSQDVLLKALTGYGLVGATPAAFYWQAADNTQVPFTLLDLGGLYGAMLTQGNTAFNQRATLKAAIRAATTVKEVQAITWTS